MLQHTLLCSIFEIPGNHSTCGNHMHSYWNLLINHHNRNYIWADTDINAFPLMSIGKLIIMYTVLRYILEHNHIIAEHFIFRWNKKKLSRESGCIMTCRELATLRNASTIMICILAVKWCHVSWCITA